MDAFLAKKMWYFSEKCSFRSLISKMKISCMLIACFIFCLFTVNAFFLQFFIDCIQRHIHILTGVQTWHINSWKKVIFAENSLFWSLIDKLEVNCMWMSFSFFDNLWEFEQKSDFSVGNNLFGQLSDVTDQQSSFYSSKFQLVLASRIQLTLV